MIDFIYVIIVGLPIVYVLRCLCTVCPIRKIICCSRKIICCCRKDNQDIIIDDEEEGEDYNEYTDKNDIEKGKGKGEKEKGEKEKGEKEKGEMDDDDDDDDELKSYNEIYPTVV